MVSRDPLDHCPNLDYRDPHIRDHYRNLRLVSRDPHIRDRYRNLDYQTLYQRLCYCYILYVLLRTIRN